MLAQNFKTSFALGITDKEFEALVKVLGMLERGELTHVEVQDTEAWYGKRHRKPKPTGAFNMGNVYTVADCQTAACIAGTCDLFFGTHFAPGGDHPGTWPKNLDELFCPTDVGETLWADITVPQAAVALRNYLTHGEPRWAEALAA